MARDGEEVEHFATLANRGWQPATAEYPLRRVVRIVEGRDFGWTEHVLSCGHRVLWVAKDYPPPPRFEVVGCGTCYGWKHRGLGRPWSGIRRGPRAAVRRGPRGGVAVNGSDVLAWYAERVNARRRAPAARR